MQIQIVTLETFAALYIDMLGVTHGTGPKAVITGTHPLEGLLTYQEACAFTGDGLLLRHGLAPYVRREGETTAGERHNSTLDT